MSDTAHTCRKQLCDQISVWYEVLIDNRQVAFISWATQEDRWFQLLETHLPYDFLHCFCDDQSSLPNRHRHPYFQLEFQHLLFPGALAPSGLTSPDFLAHFHLLEESAAAPSCLPVHPGPGAPLVGIPWHPAFAVSPGPRGVVLQGHCPPLFTGLSFPLLCELCGDKDHFCLFLQCPAGCLEAEVNVHWVNEWITLCQNLASLSLYAL